MSKDTKEEAIKKIIIRCYNIFLNRHPSDTEVFNFYEKIRIGKINEKDLIQLFVNSPEYIDRVKVLREEEKNFNDVEELISSLEGRNIESVEEKIEPEQICVTCYNETTNEGGIYFIKNEKLEPIFTKSACFGMFFDKKNKMLFALTRSEPQIIVLKYETQKFIEVPVKFSNYIIGKDIHGMYISHGKLIVMATNGEINGELVKKPTSNDKNGVGKIIISDLNIEKDLVTISNSVVINPFDCLHHHHINDITEYNGELYFSCHSYCDKDKAIIEKGAIVKIDTDKKIKIITDKTIQPHSVFVFGDRLFFCSSSYALLISINLNTLIPKLEYKGINGYLRGISITDLYFYLGYSVSFGRTNSRFKNTISGILIFNRKTGETKKISLPTNCDNIYSLCQIKN